MPAEPLFDETRRCEECGHPGACAIAGRLLGADCYQARGSCCAEFGSDELCELPAGSSSAEHP